MWIRRLWQKVFPRPSVKNRQGGATGDEQPRMAEGERQGAAKVADREVPRYHRGRRAVKDVHTNHWDLDYMSRDEMEKLARENKGTSE